MRRYAWSGLACLQLPNRQQLLCPCRTWQQLAPAVRVVLVRGQRHYREPWSNWEDSC